MQTQQASQQQIQQEPEEGKQHGTLRLFLAILGFIINVTVIVLYCTNVIKDVMAATLANSVGTMVSCIAWLYPWQVFNRNTGKGVGGSGDDLKRQTDVSILFLKNKYDEGHYSGFKDKLKQAGRTVRPYMWDGSKDLSEAIKEERREARQVYSIVTNSFLEKAKKNAGYHKFKKMHRTRESRNLFLRRFLRERHALLCVHRQSLDELKKLSVKLRLKLIDLVDISEPMASEVFLSHVMGPVEGPPAEARFLDRQVETDVNIPPPHPYFTGRQDILTRIRTAFQTKPQIVVLHGLKGSGKTQIVRAYVQQQREQYRYVLWLRLSSDKTYEEDLSKIGDCLKLAEKQDTVSMSHQPLMSEPMLRQEFLEWLQRRSFNWLLILDDCNDPKYVSFFGPAYEQGHILLTTSEGQLKDSTTTPVKSIKVSSMSKEEGALFLLRLTGILDGKAPLEQASDQQCCDALEMSDLLGNLPDALGIAGKYMNYVYGGKDCPGDRRLRNYIELYKGENHRLKEMYADLHTDDGERVVIYPWYLSFEKLQAQAPEAAETLLLCSGSPRCAELAKYVVAATSLAFPEATINEIQRCKQYVPHVKACEKLIARFALKTIGVARLYDRYGCYLREMADYEGARIYLEKGLELYKELLSEVSIQVATSMNNLAELYFAQNDLNKAKNYSQQALQIQQQTKANALNIALARSNLAIICEAKGDIEEAKTLHNAVWGVWKEQIEASEELVASSQIWEEQIGSSEEPGEPFARVNILKRLAYTYHFLGQNDKADEMYKKALDICEREEDARQTSFPETGICRANLARSYFDRRIQEKYEIAEGHYTWALRLCGNILGEGHPQVAVMYRNLADLHLQQLEDSRSTAVNGFEAQKYYYNQAFDGYEKAYKIYEQMLPYSPATAYVQKMKETLRKDYPDLWNVREREQKKQAAKKRWARQREQKKQPAKKESRKETESV